MSAPARKAKKRKDKARAAVKAAPRATGQTKNADEYLTWPYTASEVQTSQTRCRFDRAHSHMDPKGYLMPSALPGVGGGRVLPGSRPRRYPACYMTRSGVSFESALDDLYERQCALASEGINDLGPPANVAAAMQTGLGRLAAVDPRRFERLVHADEEMES